MSDVDKGVTASLLGKLPKGDGNGVDAVELASNPADIRVAVVLYDSDRTTNDTDTGSEVVRLRLRRVETLTGKDAEAARKLLEARFVSRTGQDGFDFEALEEDDEDEGVGWVGSGQEGSE